jgi:hypothetical protein
MRRAIFADKNEMFFIALYIQKITDGYKTYIGQICEKVVCSGITSRYDGALLGIIRRNNLKTLK